MLEPNLEYKEQSYNDVDKWHASCDFCKSSLVLKNNNKVYKVSAPTAGDMADKARKFNWKVVFSNSLEDGKWQCVDCQSKR